MKNSTANKLPQLLLLNFLAKLLTAEFYKHFSNELALVLLDVYESWEKFGTMGVTSRTGISMIFYIKKVIKKILQNYRPIST